jgi:hypothetical protein
MKPNVVLAERTTRLGLGMLLLASPLLELPTFPFNLLGLILIVTGAVGYCPLYGLLLSASKPKKSPPSLRIVSRPESRHEDLQAHPRTN